MTTTVLISVIMAMVIAATPILLAALGELVVEKSGVLNLGVEGMMLAGAAAGFIVVTVTGSLSAGLIAAALAGVALALAFALLTLGLAANQVATGLALTIFGTGFSALIGASYVGRTIERLAPLLPGDLSAHPLLRVVLGYDPIVYLTFGLTLAVAWFLKRTRAGMILRAVGENDHSAHAIGYRVLMIRLAALMFGGACAGVAGAYFSLALTPMWAENLTAGRGWIALALVVFAGWRPIRLMAGALLFGGVMTMELHLKAAGISLFSPEFLAMLPYLATVAVLTLISIRGGRHATGAPACLGRPFAPG